MGESLGLDCVGLDGRSCEGLRSMEGLRLEAIELNERKRLDNLERQITSCNNNLGEIVEEVGALQFSKLTTLRNEQFCLLRERTQGYCCKALGAP